MNRSEVNKTISRMWRAYFFEDCPKVVRDQIHRLVLGSDHGGLVKRIIRVHIAQKQAQREHESAKSFRRAIIGWRSADTYRKLFWRTATSFLPPWQVVNQVLRVTDQIGETK